MQPREQIIQLVTQALTAAVESGELVLTEVPEVTLERPRDEGHGDWACTLALRLAKQAHMAPRAIADIMVAHITALDAACDQHVVNKVEVAGPGFINFYLNASATQSLVAKIRQEGASYGSCQAPEGQEKVLIEYVSANPTGPMHVGHGRWAALGSATANLLRHAGHEVTEEFYINDQGSQMNKFGESIAVRYQQQLGRDAQIPEGGYGGAYVNDIAAEIIARDGDKWLDADPEERRVEFREYGYAWVLKLFKDLCGSFGTNFEVWTSERGLYQPDEAYDGMCAVDWCLEQLRQKDLVYDADGAMWFRSSNYGDDKDRVLKKQDGAYTYFASDVAYHFLKKKRGFDCLIDIWGADHHGYVARVKAVLAAMGYPGALEIMLGQLVNLFRDGEAVRMSKRTGEMVTFQELVDEVGVDATRFYMLSRSTEQPIDFDISVAKKQDSSNPVYYVQYAHARICSILRNAAGVDYEPGQDMEQVAARAIPAEVDLGRLVHPAELALIRKMGEFVDLVEKAARDRAPFRLTHYVQEVASAFHHFYADCSVLKAEDEGLRDARLALCDATRILIAVALGILGISAPVAMEHREQ